MEYVIGRRGSLAYLDGSVAQEVGLSGGWRPTGLAFVSGMTLRPTVEQNLDIARNTFAVGNLTDDELLRTLRLRRWRLRLRSACFRTTYECHVLYH